MKVYFPNTFYIAWGLQHLPIVICKSFVHKYLGHARCIDDCFQVIHEIFNPKMLSPSKFTNICIVE